ncbi:conserved hypothetical protein [uncultured Alphaproteobacteria bacterium]|uniref:KilA/APSES-type HTH DNA-binding domain-containing protein n=1 Tax=uncultured Alphaproteobacteria bacterium TaxID=91750 RepID=A0A212KM13_9PROT|nr:conserved hypothetical protein [uncultured Alphaproteobacteria bacterium]
MTPKSESPNGGNRQGFQGIKTRLCKKGIDMKNITHGGEGVKAALVYNGAAIRAVGERLNLTDMWKAAGADPSRRPVEWLRSAEAIRFVEFLAETTGEKVGDSHLFQVAKGRTGSTTAHWQIGLAYAKYLSPDFHMWCNTVVREKMEGRSVSVDVLTPGEVGGVVKKVLWKQVPEILGQIVDRYLPGVIEERVASALAADPRYAATDYVAPLDVAIRYGVPPKRRNCLCKVIGDQMARISADWAVPVKLSRETQRRLFSPEVVAHWERTGGKEVIRCHKAKIEGQGLLHLVARRRRPVEHQPQAAE